ncbi:uncharacterized protein LOC123704278 [Colias croceus]|uniref:uncharacterized protein LOC123704278 n=1 Tax=Colias crocea TaxID=72248 RepID=UPI001E280D42|nr:uncharacterized protein LOC123704278 [Colias croceus]
MWCMIELITITVTAFIGDSIVSSRDQLKIIINDIIVDYALPKDVRNEAKILLNAVEAWPLLRSDAKIFMHVLECWSLEINIFHMIQFNKRLLLKFISVSTTYLIFLLQISHLM